MRLLSFTFREKCLHFVYNIIIKYKLQNTYIYVEGSNNYIDHLVHSIGERFGRIKKCFINVLFLHNNVQYCAKFNVC